MAFGLWKQALTEFDDFTMPGESQRLLAKQQQQQKLEEEARLLQQARAFVAKPLPASTYAPSFVAQPSDRPPLQCLDNVLAGEARAKERKAYNEAQRQRVESEAKAREALVAQREAEAEAQYLSRYDVPIEEGGLR